jgi:hypothetical protein
MTRKEALMTFLKNLDTDCFNFSPKSETVSLDGYYTKEQLQIIIELLEEFKNE